MRNAFELRVTVCAAAPLTVLRALDRPGLAVCDVVRAWEKLPERVALLSPHAVLLAEEQPGLGALLTALRRAAPVHPPRVAALFRTVVPVDAAGEEPCGAVKQACAAPIGLLAAPSMPRREKRARSMLAGLGMAPGLAGFDALALGAAWLSAWPAPAPPLQTGLYPWLARREGISPAAVEKRMRGAIESAWLHGDLAAQNRLLGLSVSADRGKPTNSELLFRLAERVGDGLLPCAEGENMVY